MDVCEQAIEPIAKSVWLIELELDTAAHVRVDRPLCFIGPTIRRLGRMRDLGGVDAEKANMLAIHGSSIGSKNAVGRVRDDRIAIEHDSDDHIVVGWPCVVPGRKRIAIADVARRVPRIAHSMD